MQQNFMIKSELSEMQITSDIVSYLGWISNFNNPFRIIDIYGQTNADKRVELIIPLYFRVKVPQGLKQLKNSFSIYSIRPSPLQNIRLYRLKNQLPSNPTLYFQLTAKKNHKYLEHNFLLELNQCKNTKAFYISPLALNKKEYNEMLNDSLNKNIYQPSYQINNQQKHWTSFINLDPYLRGFMSIIPRGHVNTNNHFYHFSKSGNLSSWLPQNLTFGKQLSNTLKDIFHIPYLSEKSWVSPIEHLDSLKSTLIYDNEMLSLSKKKNISPMQQLQNLGGWIYYWHRIRPILIGTTKKELNEWLSKR